MMEDDSQASSVAEGGGGDRYDSHHNNDGDSHNNNPFEGIARTSSEEAARVEAGGMRSALEIQGGGDDEYGEGVSPETENGNSLPNPEELKTSTSMTSKRGADCHMPMWLGLLLIAVVATAIGLGVGLGVKNDKKNGDIIDETDGGGFGGSGLPGFGTVNNRDKQRKLMEQYVIDMGVSNEGDFTDKSPQTRALNWMANMDGMQMITPRGDLGTKDGYLFITRYAMAVFYYSTGGASWNYDLLFLTEHDTCEWFDAFPPPEGQIGVLCNEQTNEIVGMSFLWNNLSGNLPKELSALTTLSYFETVGNFIEGQIPSEMRKLTNMQTAIFASNSFSGTFPEWIQEWKNLQFLYMSNNLFGGEVPSVVGNLQELEVLALDGNTFKGNADFAWELRKLAYLYLDGNDFTGRLPSSISQKVPLLVNLDLSSNEFFGGLPSDLFQMTNLIVLDLHDNLLSGSIPGDVSPDISLEFLALHQNILESNIPSTLAEITSLTHIDLSLNELDGTIPDLDALNQLTYLFLSENKFDAQEIPTFIYGYNNLRELSLKSLKLTGTISSLIGLLDNLVVLDLDNNSLRGPIPPEIGTLQQLQFLLLNRNSFTGVVPADLGMLQELKLVLLDGNNITGSIDDTICQGENLEVATADCDILTCDCCTPCCKFGVPDCHDNNLIPNMDLMWESSYERLFFDFSANNSSSVFVEGDDDTFTGP